jgi:penicillin-binding protein 2
MQVVEASKYRRLAEENRVKRETLPAARGMIFDRYGTLLVESRPSFAISLVPSRINNEAGTLGALAALLGLSADDLTMELQEARQRSRREPLRVLKDVGLDVVSRVEERAGELEGVIVETIPLRRYAFGTSAGHLLGYLGEISDAELARREVAGYRPGDYVGRTGVEEQYEEILRGQDGIRFIEVDSQGREIGPVERMDPIPPEPGRNLYLTIDIQLQRLGEELLGMRSGAIAALRPHSGEILALVSSPPVDPNLLSGRLTSRQWRALSEDRSFPLWDRSTMGGYPPGSTFKVVTAAAALDSQVIDAASRLSPCTGGWRFGRRLFRCWSLRGHGSLTVVPAIIHSCDVFFYQLGARLKLSRLSAVAGASGLGQKTGIDLPREGSGLVPTPAWYDRKLGPGRWTEGTAVNMSIGQGELLVTPLQMACLYAAIAGDGPVHRPHVLLRAEDVQGRVVRTREDSSWQLPVSATTLRLIREGLWGVVNAGGTGTVARLEGIGVAGKTGTAQNPHGNDHSWFVAFAPYDDPQIAVAVVVENAGHGSTVAAPLARELIEAYLRGGRRQGPSARGPGGETSAGNPRPLTPPADSLPGSDPRHPSDKEKDAASRF